MPSPPAGSRDPGSSPPATPSARPAGHLDPSAQSGLAPGIMRMTVEEGIADGIDEVRKAVRYQITHGAKLIKCCASGGVMTPDRPAGRAAVLHRGARRDRRRGPPPRPPGRDALPTATPAVNAAIDAGIDCIEHGMMIGDDTIQRMVDTGTFLVSTCALTENWDISDQPKSLQAKAAEVFPKAKESLSKAIEAGVKVALGTDAPAIFHGRNAEELDVLVQAGHDARSRPSAPRPPSPPTSSTRPTSAASPPRCSPTSSASPATRSPTSPPSSECRSS